MPHHSYDTGDPSKQHPASNIGIDAINRSLAIHGEALPEDETVHDAIARDSRLIEQSTG